MVLGLEEQSRKKRSWCRKALRHGRARLREDLMPWLQEAQFRTAHADWDEQKRRNWRKFALVRFDSADVPTRLRELVPGAHFQLRTPLVRFHRRQRSGAN